MKTKLFPLTVILIVLCSYFNVNATLNSVDPIKIIRNNETLLLHSNNKITFEIGSIELNDSAIYELSIIATRLKNNPNLKIEIAVHNDARSDIDISKAITNKRATTIKEYLVNRGVNLDNLMAKGYGDKYIINRCKPMVKCSNTEHNVNKRVELVILNPEILTDYVFVLPKENRTLTLK